MFILDDIYGQSFSGLTPYFRKPLENWLASFNFVEKALGLFIKVVSVAFIALWEGVNETMYGKRAFQEAESGIKHIARKIIGMSGMVPQSAINALLGDDPNADVDWANEKAERVGGFHQ